MWNENIVALLWFSKGILMQNEENDKSVVVSSFEKFNFGLKIAGYFNNF